MISEAKRWNWGGKEVKKSLPIFSTHNEEKNYSKGYIYNDQYEYHLCSSRKNILHIDNTISLNLHAS